MLLCSNSSNQSTRTNKTAYTVLFYKRFIHMYINILIYNQEKRECTMQKKTTKKTIYKSINKQWGHVFVFYIVFRVLLGREK